MSRPAPRGCLRPLAALWSATLPVVALLGGCSDGSLTEIVVVVDTDMVVPTDIDRVRIEVEGLEEGPKTASADLLGGAPAPLPVTLGVVRRGGPLGPLTVTVAGELDGADQISRQARVSFVRGRTVVLRLDLLTACLGVVCSPGFSCGAGGGCRAVDVDPAELSPWDGTAPRLDADLPDGGPFDARPGDALPDDGRIPLDAPPPDAGPERVTDGLLVLYPFSEGEGDVVHDVSGVDPALDLVIADPAAVRWEGGTLRVFAPTVAASEDAATKVIDACVASGEITVEAWVADGVDLMMGPARVVTVSEGASTRDFTLAQEGDHVEVRLRTSMGGENGEPYQDSVGALTGRLRHLVFTHEMAEGRTRLYVDNTLAASTVRDGDFSTWDPAFRLALANEMGADRAWLGVYHLVAIYSRALSPDEVRQNFEAGP